MAKAISITPPLRREAAAAAPTPSCLGRAFLRVIGCLADLLRAEARSAAVGDPWAAPSAAALRDELAARLELIADPPVAIGPGDAALVSAAQEMLGRLDGHSNHPNRRARSAARLAMSPADALQARRSQELAARALALFVLISFGDPPAQPIVPGAVGVASCAAADRACRVGGDRSRAGDRWNAAIRRTRHLLRRVARGRLGRAALVS